MNRRTISTLLITVVVAGLLAIAPGQAQAANITQYTTFECGAGSVTVYFPRLTTSSGFETIYYSPDLWVYTSTGWKEYDTSKPWYSTSVGTGGNGQWYAYPSNINTIRIPFWNLPAGWYAVKGYFFQGTNHWGTVWGTTSTSCKVS